MFYCRFSKHLVELDLSVASRRRDTPWYRVFLSTNQFVCYHLQPQRTDTADIPAVVTDMRKTLLDPPLQSYLANLWKNWTARSRPPTRDINLHCPNITPWEGRYHSRSTLYNKGQQHGREPWNKLIERAIDGTCRHRHPDPSWTDIATIGKGGGNSIIVLIGLLLMCIMGPDLWMFIIFIVMRARVSTHLVINTHIFDIVFTNYLSLAFYNLQFFMTATKGESHYQIMFLVCPSIWTLLLCYMYLNSAWMDLVQILLHENSSCNCKDKLIFLWNH